MKHLHKQIHITCEWLESRTGLSLKLKIVDYLKKINKKIILLSGDVESEVKRIAEITGIEEYYWQKNPLEKAQILEKLNAERLNIKRN